MPPRGHQLSILRWGGGGGRCRGRRRGERDDAGVAVGRDGVEVFAAGDLADDQRRQQLALGGGDSQGVGDALGVEEGGGAEELGGLRGGGGVGDQLRACGGAHVSSRSAAARNSSGSTPQTSQSSTPSGRRRWPRIVPSCTQPSPATVFFATSLRAGMRP